MERLNKFLAHAGVGSRRHCDDLIFRGRVKIDGAVVREPGTRVDPQTQEVIVDDNPIKVEQLVYWLVNKPRGYLCTNHDPQGRPRALDLVPHVHQRVYTVGRLDEDSEGLLLMTNDGDLANKLTHPRFGVTKTYLVQVAGKPNKEDIQQLLDGVWLADGKVKAKRVRRLKSQGDSTWLEIVLNEGKNREIRRMLAQQEHKVMRLKRISIGPLRLDRISKGKCRKLAHDEITALRAYSERKPMEREEVPEELLMEPVERPRPVAQRPARPMRPTRPGEPSRGERPSHPAKPERPRQSAQSANTEGPRRKRPESASRSDKPLPRSGKPVRSSQGRPTDGPRSDGRASKRPSPTKRTEGPPRRKPGREERPGRPPRRGSR